MPHGGKISDDQGRAEGAHCRRGPQPAEPDRSDVQNLVGKNRQQRCRASEQHGKHIERDRCQNHLLARNETHSGNNALPWTFLAAAPLLCAALNRQYEKEKNEPGDRIDRVNLGETDLGYDQSH